MGGRGACGYNASGGASACAQTSEGLAPLLREKPRASAGIACCRTVFGDRISDRLVIAEVGHGGARVVGGHETAAWAVLAGCATQAPAGQGRGMSMGQGARERERAYRVRMHCCVAAVRRRGVRPRTLAPFDSVRGVGSFACADFRLADQALSARHAGPRELEVAQRPRRIPEVVV